MKRMAAALLIASAISSQALAADDGFYAGINLGDGKPGISTVNGSRKDSSFVGGGVVGYKFNKNFATEAQFTGVGKVTDKAGGTAKGDAVSLSGIGILPLNEDFDLYGKIGVAVTRTTVSSDLVPMNDATRAALTYGVGAQYNVNKSIGVRLGWDHYGIATKNASGSKNDDNAQVITVGAVYNF